MTEPGGQRFHELDAFRGIAAVWVMLFHFGLRYQNADMPYVEQVPQVRDLARAVFAWLPDFGVMPVAWFFIISGFVMTWTLERCRTWRDFAASRAARLYPVYWAAVTVIVAAEVLQPLPGQGVGLAKYLANLTMIQGIFGVGHVSGVFWSLTVELIFYIGMACLLRFGLVGRLYAICTVWALACLANHLLALGGIEVFWRVQKYALLNYGHFLIAGIMFYQLWRGRRPAASIAIIAICLLSVFLAYTPATAVVYSLFFALMWLAMRGRLGFIANRPMVWLGSISYALYLVHEGLGFRLMYALELAGVPRLASIAAAISMSLVVAEMLTRAVDQRGRRLLRAMLQPRTAAIPAPAGDR